MARLGQISLLLCVLSATLLGLTGCAVPVKIREDWKVRGPQEVPLSEATSVWQEISAGAMPGKEDLDLYNDAVRQSVVQVARNWASPERSLSPTDYERGRES